mgnify:CR=1 FL=1
MNDYQRPVHRGRAKASNSGFSLIELLVAMVVVALFITGVFSVFVNFLSQSGEQAALSKRSFDTRLGLRLVRHDLAQAGFGIAKKDLSGAVVGNGTSVTVRSVAFHGLGSEAGEHGIVQVGGNVSNSLGAAMDSNQPGVVLSPSRDLLETVQAGNITASDRNLFFATQATGANSYFVDRTYALSATKSDDESCADDAFNLQYSDAVASGKISGIVNCVLDFQVRYGFELTNGGLGFSSDPAAPPPSVVDGRVDVLKVGLLVQAGQEFRNQTVSPATISYSDPDIGGSVDLDAAERHYRWQVMEWTVPLWNME